MISMGPFNRFKNEMNSSLLNLVSCRKYYCRKYLSCRTARGQCARRSIQQLLQRLRSRPRWSVSSFSTRAGSRAYGTGSASSSSGCCCCASAARGGKRMVPPGSLAAAVSATHWMKTAELNIDLVLILVPVRTSTEFPGCSPMCPTRHIWRHCMHAWASSASWTARRAGQAGKPAVNNASSPSACNLAR